MRIYFIILGLSLALQLSAQRGANSNYGTKSLSIGGISSVLKGNDAIINNFAAITGASELGIILSSERRFSLQELTSITMGIHLPTGKFGHLGLRINSYGFNDYKEQKISLAYAKKLHKKIAVSANLDYNSLRISEHGSTQFLSFGIGFFGEISKSLRYGISIFTPEKITIVNETEVPSFLKFGIAKSFSDKLEASVEIEKIIDETITEDLRLIERFFYQIKDIVK